MTATATKIFYTGDMATARGWFVATLNAKGSYDLTEIDGDRVILGIGRHQVGNVYQGHCGTRFVTEAAYNTYRDERMAEYAKVAAKWTPESARRRVGGTFGT